MKTQGFLGASGILLALLFLPGRLTNAIAQVTNFQRIYSFGDTNLSGSFPLRIIESADGRLYGTAQTETPDFEGMLFRINKDGTGYQVLHRFKETDPAGDGPSELLEASDGALYGVTREGGANNRGAVFKINRDGTGLTEVYAFGGVADSGLRSPNGPLIEGSDRALYGVSWAGGFANAGMVYKLQKDGTQFQILKQFGAAGDGAYPVGVLMEASDGWLYGTTSSGGGAGKGTVFKISKAGTGYQVINDFSSDGYGPRSPFSELIEDRDGVLYGTSESGGTQNRGTVFKLRKDGSGFAVLRRFDWTNDPASPYGPLTLAPDGSLYGTSSAGGEFGRGTLFKVNKDGGDFRVIRNFSDPGDGDTLRARLILSSNNVFYSCTLYGGKYRQGTMFRFDPSSSSYSSLWDFSDSGGAPIFPYSALTQDSGGYLYGATGNSLIYRLRPDGSDFKVLYNVGWTSTNEGSSVGGLTVASDGWLYGTAQERGLYGAGTLFKLARDGSGFAVLHAFGQSTNDGAFPVTGIIEGSDGKLYGTTRQGGPWYGGSVFRINKDGSGHQVLKVFQQPGSDGIILQDPVTEGLDGYLYGVATLGGAYGAGAVFRLAKDGLNFLRLNSLAGGASGSNPNGSLVDGGDGWFYGVTVHGGSNNVGTVYKISKYGTLAVIKHFTTNVGTFPSGPLWQGLDGALYGSTQTGGAYDNGVIFKLNKDGTGFAVVHHFGGGSQGRALFKGIIQGNDGAFYGPGGGGDLSRGIVFRYGQSIALTKSGETVQLKCSGILGYTYRIQRSLDLANWTTLASRYIGPDLFGECVDSPAPPGAAFYRVVPASTGP